MDNESTVEDKLKVWLANNGVQEIIINSPVVRLVFARRGKTIEMATFHLLEVLEAYLSECKSISVQISG